MWALHLRYTIPCWLVVRRFWSCCCRKNYTACMQSCSKRCKHCCVLFFFFLFNYLSKTIFLRCFFFIMNLQLLATKLTDFTYSPLQLVSVLTLSFLRGKTLVPVIEKSHTVWLIRESWEVQHNSIRGARLSFISSDSLTRPLEISIQAATSFTLFSSNVLLI